MKTFCFLKALLKVSSPKDSILFLAETIEREIDLRRDIEKFSTLIDKDILKYNIEFACYQSAYKWENRKYHFVCADEIHNSLSLKYSLFFRNNTYKFLLGLSATPDRTVKYENEDGEVISKGQLLDEICPVIYKYSLDQSVKDKTSRRLNIYVIDHNLDSVNKNYKGGSKKKSFYTTEAASYNYWDNEVTKAYWSNSRTFDKDLKIKITAGARAKVLYTAYSKTIIVRKLLKAISEKVLIFGNDLDTLESITENVVSSRNTENQNLELRNKFDNNEIKVMAANKLLNQGANIKNLDNIILHSYYSKELHMIQKLGRLRNSDKDGNVFIIRTIGTSEVKWFDKMFENIKEHNMIKCKDVDECIKLLKNA